MPRCDVPFESADEREALAVGVALDESAALSVFDWVAQPAASASASGMHIFSERVFITSLPCWWPECGSYYAPKYICANATQFSGGDAGSPGPFPRDHPL